MEGLAPFLLFLFFMIINIYTGQKRREPKKKQKQEFPDIYDNPPPRQNRKRKGGAKRTFLFYGLS